MDTVGVSIEHCKDVNIGKIVAHGTDTVLEVKSTNKLSVQGINANNCGTAINLEECWDSDIKNINIKSHSRKFSYTTLASSIMTAKNIK